MNDLLSTVNAIVNRRQWQLCR